jgi:hypothetical protein
MSDLTPFLMIPTDGIYFYKRISCKGEQPNLDIRLMLVHSTHLVLPVRKTSQL